MDHKMGIPCNMSPSPALPNSWYIGVRMSLDPIPVHIWDTEMHLDVGICVPREGPSIWKTSGITVLALNNGGTGSGQVQRSGLTPWHNTNWRRSQYLLF